MFAYFVFQLRLNEGRLDCRLRLRVILPVSEIHKFSKTVGATSVVTWSKYLTEALQVLITTAQCPSDLVAGFVHLRLLWLQYCLLGCSLLQTYEFSCFPWLLLIAWIILRCDESWDGVRLSELPVVLVGAELCVDAWSEARQAHVSL